MADYHKKGVSGVAANVDKGPKTAAGLGGPKSGANESGSKGLGKAKVSKGMGSGVEGAHNFEFAEGGDTPMFGHQNADPQKGTKQGGGTAHDNGPAQSQGTGQKFAEGGTQKMFGFAPSQMATAGITSAR
jgi:hypothetical protein